MEPRFGCDFSRVRIHSDARAAASAQSVNALAYTVGTDVAFAAGQFSPATTRGRKLLAHELTHVVQQGQGASSVSRAPNAVVQRKETGVQPAPEVEAGPGATCSLDQHRKIEPAAYKANQWLSRAIPALDAFLAGAKTQQARASTIIHEFGHALLSLSKTVRMLIIDRAYKQDPYYHYLTTGEALTNAESYAMFAREVATGSSPAHAFIVDSLTECPDAWVPIISDALSKARAWNHKAALHTDAKHQFSVAYKRLDLQLKVG
jgi:hypothetical protein